MVKDESTQLSQRVLYTSLLAFAMIQSGFRYLRATLGERQLFYDAEKVWIPFADHVLSGVPMYVPPAIDNKPPLFHYLNVAVRATGAYVEVFYLLVGVANAVAAILLYRWVRNTWTHQTAIIAAFLFLIPLPYVKGTIINVRSFAVVFLLLAVIATRPVRRGIAVAIAGLFSQPAAVAIPILFWDGAKRNHNRSRYTVLFGGAGLVTAAAAYLPVGLLWGPEALTNAIAWSVAITHQGPVVATPITEPLQYASARGRDALMLAYLLIPATLYILLRYNWLPRDWSSESFVTALAVVLSATLLLKALVYYWILPLPFLATIASLYLTDIIN